MSRPAIILANFEASQHFMYKRLLRRAGMDPDAFDVLFADTPNLHQCLASLRPSVVIACGEAPLWAILNQYGILRWVNRVQTIRVHDAETETNVSMPVVFNFAPEMLVYQRAVADDPDEDYDGPKRKKKTRVLRNPPRYQGVAVGVMRRALYIAEHGAPVLPTDQYLLDPTPEQFSAWADDCLQALCDPDSQARFLSWDIETPYKMKERDEEDFEEEARVEDNTILRISFSHLPGMAASVPWQGPWLPVIRRLLAFTGQHVGWNIAGFDVPVVQANGIEVRGAILDMMDGWHLLQPDMDKGLEFVSAFFTALPPWKHLADEFGREALYSCYDADAALQNALGIQKGLQAQGIWDLFLRQCDLALVLREAGDRGNVIDVEAQHELEVELTELLRVALLEAQALVPAEFRKAKLYVRLPKDAVPEQWVEGIREVEVRSCTMCGKLNVSAKTHPCCKKSLGTVEMVKTEATFFARTKLPADISLEDLKKWLANNGFNPNSSDQLIQYIKANNHPLGYNPKTEMDSADSKQLQKLAVKYGTKHPIYQHTCGIHKISKALSTYVFGMRPDKTGRVHSTYVNAPWTWRLCIAKGTLVNTVRGRVPIEQVRAGDLVQTFDDEGRLTLRPVKWAGPTGTKPVVRVAWQAGYGPSTFTGHVDMTADHRVRLVDGSYKEAQHLSPLVRRGGRVRGRGDRVLAVHSSANGWGYEMLYATNGPRNGERAHRFVLRTLGHDVEGQHVHHRNGDKLDNRPENLEAVSAAFHAGVTGAGNGRPKKGAFKAHLRKHLEDTAYAYTVNWCGYAPHNHIITGVTPLPGEVEVFDIEVADTMNFIAGELCVHNSSRNVNMQNQGKREANPYAKKARKTIIATPGHMLVQADSSAIEAVFVGYFMNDPAYIALARQSVHAYVACHKLGWEFNPEAVQRVKREQGALYEAVKTVVHGTNFGMTPYLMHMNRPDLFPRMKDAKEMQELLFAALPGLKTWHWEIRQFAQKNNYLLSPWGVKFYFYDIFTYKRDGERAIIYHPSGEPVIILGKDGKRVVAALPQSSAGFFMRDNLVMLGQTEAREWMGANVSVHDGYCLDVPTAKVDTAIELLSNILTRPIPEMAGLQVGCEIEVGRDWGSMKKVKTVSVGA